MCVRVCVLAYSLQLPQHKCLGIVLDDQIKDSSNTYMVIKMCNQRLHFLRFLNKLRVQREIFTLFYKATVESIICFSVIVWYG